MSQDAFRIEQDSIVVPVGKRIPKVCLKCGGREEVVRREQTYMVGASTNYGAAGGVAGASLAAFARNMFRDDAATQFWFICGVVALLSAAAFVWYRVSAKVVLRLSFCRACEARLEEALGWRRVLLVGVAAFGVLAVAGVMLDSVAMMVCAVLVLLGVIALGVWAKIPQKMVQTAWVRPTEVALKVDPHVATAVLEGVARARAKKDARRAATKGEAG